jgi:tetratricopeptide (TPR) repeat protein
MRLLLIVLFFVSVFFSCKEKSSGTTDVKKDVAYSQLSDSLRYDTKAIQKFNAGLASQQQDSGKKVFLQAIDLLKNKKDAAGSINLFYKAIALYPNDKTYYELGNAFLESNQPKDALKAFAAAEQLGYSPLSYVLFKTACAYSDLEQEDKGIEYLSHAIENGFVDRDKIFNEPHLAFVRKAYNFTSTYNAAMSGNGDPQTILWEAYSRGYQPSVFPLVINQESYAAIKKVSYISYDYEKFIPEMRDFKFSREVGNEFFYYTKVSAKEKYEAVIYGCNDVNTQSNPLVSSLLVSYDKTGKLLDKLMVAGHKTYDDPFKVLVLNENLNFEVKDYKQTYEKDPGENGYENNKVTKNELIKTTRYKIDEMGKFKEVKEAFAVR